ncbi:hypothetical protein EVAR_46265_1 [Eumeta japonica]|uniref:Uncharacterized protein n=1 Tax=Eumeta variegata TaxID=151549 RepID=A0A4C1Y7L1_EUMVA|nr:hypothetical protein EVAR_46265_1 [Eumeta japonica]
MCDRRLRTARIEDLKRPKSCHPAQCKISEKRPLARSNPLESRLPAKLECFLEHSPDFPRVRRLISIRAHRHEVFS